MRSRTFYICGLTGLLKKLWINVHSYNGKVLLLEQGISVCILGLIRSLESVVQFQNCKIGHFWIFYSQSAFEIMDLGIRIDFLFYFIFSFGEGMCSKRCIRPSSLSCWQDGITPSVANSQIVQRSEIVTKTDIVVTNPC